ncbi:MAG: hypothetical protein OEQ24_10815 [Gammaproteobacteria bacterium]|nr:hypothetical protein [Gammaproteobacteria bacterium]
MSVNKDIEYVLDKLAWMREQSIWPNGLRYLWTDAFGLVLLVSLYKELNEDQYLKQAEWLVAEVERVLGRTRGIRIGEAADRDGQYFHYLAMWLYALAVLGKFIPTYQDKGVELVEQIHDRFVIPNKGVIWKMNETLDAPYPGYGLGALDAFDGYISYRMLDESSLLHQIGDMKKLIDQTAFDLTITQDLGLGMMLWLTHFFPNEEWAKIQKSRCVSMLDQMWQEPGYFCREPYLPDTKFAFTNYGVSIGLQAASEMPERVQKLNDYFEEYRSGDEYDTNAITHVMACTSHFPGYFVQS